MVGQYHLILMMTDADHDVFSLELNDRDDREETSELEGTVTEQRSHRRVMQRKSHGVMTSS